MSQELVGQTIDHFKIDALLGEGGMGAVYRATDLSLKRRVAIKFVHSHLARRPEFRQRFTQEAQTVAQLNHPSIIQIYSFGYANSVGMPYMVMEYLPKGSLTKYVKRLEKSKQQLELREVLLLIAQISDALAYSHRHNVIHRDVKPDNILLRPIESFERRDLPVRAVVTDFGLVKLRDSSGLTATGNIMGTLAYMSPEQCQGAELDGRADIYSLGIMLYQLVTGSLPFTTTSHAQAIHAHLYEAPPPPQSLRPDLPASVISILERMLAKQPHERYRTASQVSIALRQAAEGATAEQLAIIDRQTEFAPQTSLISAIMDDDKPPLATVLGDDDDFTMGGFTRPAVGAAPSSAQHAGLEIGLAQQTVALTPGRSNSLLLNIANRDSQSILCAISVQGVPREWVSMVDSLLIGGGRHEQLPISILAPRTSDVAAGTRPIVVTVATGGQTIVGATGQQRSYTVRGNVHIEPYEQLKATMTAEPVVDGDTKKLMVVNEGNAAADFSVAGNSPNDALAFDAQPRQLRLAPNDSAEFQLKLTANQRPLLGSNKTIPFSINVQQEHGSAEQRITGTVVVKPRVPLWLASLVGVLALLLIGAIIFNQFSAPPVTVDEAGTANAIAQAEAAAEQTRAAEVTVGNQSANATLTAAAQLSADSDATIAAATSEAAAQANATVAAEQTAAAATADTDGDGVLDIDEEAGCTDRLSSDTDNDGLGDSAELAPTSLTDPCNPDSDGDTLNDGDEVAIGTNPLVADTDGDGIPDGVEISGNGRPDTSDPLRADSDGDGIPDGTDTTPRDTTPTNTPEPTRPAPLSSVLPRTGWLPDSTQLLFVSDRDGDDSIYWTNLTNPENVQRLSVPPSGGYDWWPSWCNESVAIFERGDPADNQEIYLYSLVDGTVTQFTSNVQPLNSAKNGIASCSPDGRYVALSSLSNSADGGNRFEVGMFQIDSGDPSFIPLGGGGRFGGNPTWSADSQSVIFMQFDAPVQLYRVNLATIDSATNITNNASRSHKYPAWSPVDQRIAFACGSTSDVWHLCIISADGGGVENTGVLLGTGKERGSRSNGRIAHFGRPTWSPDGRFIAFAGSPYGGQWDIYLYELSTGELYNVTNTPNHDEMHPSWAP